MRTDRCLGLLNKRASYRAQKRIHREGNPPLQTPWKAYLALALNVNIEVHSLTYTFLE